MLITRHHHLRYMTKLTPILIVLYILQVLIYRQLAPEELVQEITIFLGAGLTLLITGFCIYDHFHQIILKPNYLEVSFSPLKIKHDILYAKIIKIRIKSTRFGYGGLKIYQQDGQVLKLYHVDNAKEIATFIQTNNPSVEFKEM